MKTHALFCHVALLIVILMVAEVQSYNMADLDGLLRTKQLRLRINNQGKVVGYWSDTNEARGFLLRAASLLEKLEKEE